MIIAFIFTEYQQKILNAILIQNNIENIDILFLRKTIKLDKNLSKLCKKVLPLNEIPYSWRNIYKFYNDFNKNIKIHIKKDIPYKIFSWSLEFPQVRLALRFIKNYKLNLLEDGAGSYINRTFFDFNLKDSLVNKLITLSMDILLSGNILKNIENNTHGYSLYKNCYPSYKINNLIIENSIFSNVVKNSIKKGHEIFLENEDFIFIQQSYVEMTLMSNNEYINLHLNALIKIKNHFNIKKIYWKLHPRTNKSDELKRIKILEEKVNIKIEIIELKISMEELTLLHKKKNIKYLSFGSSALYVIPALLNNSNNVYNIYSDFLIKRLKGQGDINELYKKIGVNQI